MVVVVSSTVFLRAWYFCSLFLVLGAVATAATNRLPQKERLNDAFQAALDRYNTGNFAEAARGLEDLLREVPESFEVNELLGLVYSAESQDAKANIQLEKAVQLNPRSAAARTNLAANLTRLGRTHLAGLQFRKAVELEPRSFDANHNMGEFYVRSGKIAEAIPFLQRAQRVAPSSYDNGYDLALAYSTTGQLDQARTQVQALLPQKDTAELHDLLGDIEEKSGHYVVAANEYQAAAHKDPSESNLFDWGSELLIHQTLEPAVEVFQQGVASYPRSPRMAIGLGMALYSLGKYDEAVRSLLRAADLDPSDPRCYPFLSRAYDSSPSQANAVIQRFRRFTELQPRNGQALYYYAMSLWRGKRAQDPNPDFSRVESLLKTSISLAPTLAEARLQLGNLYFDQGKYADSIPEYLQALQIKSDLPDARYRLAQAYVRTSKKDLAEQQLQIYRKQRARHMAELDRQRADIRQFVYSSKGIPATKP